MTGRLPRALRRREWQRILNAHPVHEAVQEDLARRAQQIVDEARRMTPKRTGTTSLERKSEPLHVRSERADQPKELPQ